MVHITTVVDQHCKCALMSNNAYGQFGFHSVVGDNCWASADQLDICLAGRVLTTHTQAPLLVTVNSLPV